MNEYVDYIKELLDRIVVTQNEVMEQASDAMTAAIIDKRSLFIFGAAHAGMVSQEMCYRAGGLALINPIFPRELNADVRPITQSSQMENCEEYGRIIMSNIPIKKNDILIVHSVSGRNAATIELVLEAKRKGAQIIAITNLNTSTQVTSRHSSGQKLYQIADIVIDNCGDVGDAGIKIEGMEQKVAPSSTLTGCAIANMLSIAVIKKLLAQQFEPPVFRSANIDGGYEFNQEIFSKYKDQIHYM